MRRKTHTYEDDVLAAFEKGTLASVVTKAQRARLKEAARATAEKVTAARGNSGSDAAPPARKRKQP